MVKNKKNPDQGFWKHVFRYFVKVTGWPSAVLYFKPRYFYEDKKIQKRSIKGGAIIVSNHINGMDAVLYMVVFVRRYLRSIVGEEVYEHKVLGWMLKSFGSIKVVRASMQQDYIYQAINTLNRGGVIKIYPESHFRPNDDYKLRPFKTSYIIMAAQTGAPIIPCYHNGRHGIFKREKMAIGKPMYTKDFFSGINPTIEQINDMNEAVENKVLQLQKMIEN